METGTVRNLEQIRETEGGVTPSRLGTLVLASFGGACIVFAALALVRSPPREPPPSGDPLGDLVSRAQPVAGAARPRVDLAGHDVTFPGVLSDAENPTTALAALGPKPGGQEQAGGGASLPAEVGEKLPPVTLPAKDVLSSTPVVTRPRDPLTTLAAHASREGEAELAERGAPGGYQLQVSSFKTEKEAGDFAAALRRRGHRAYYEAAQVRGRGTWYRVRVGPFKHRHVAATYRQEFELKERLVTFLVEPPRASPTTTDAP